MLPAFLKKRCWSNRMPASQLSNADFAYPAWRTARGHLLPRPYVFAFLAVFAWAATSDLGALRMLGFLAWGFAVAFASEYASTRIGVPFGLYHYTGATRGVELYLGNVPFFDSLSFPFLAYASFCLARRVLGLRIV